MEEPEVTEGPAMTAAVIATTVVVLLGLFVTMDAVQGTQSGLTEGISNWVNDTFLK